MIKKLTISNYKSIGSDCVINLDPLTVFVGQNGSGKSNIIDSIRFVADSLKLGLEGAITKRHGIKAIRRWSSGRPLHVAIKLDIQENEYEGYYQFEITSHRTYDYIVKSERAHVDYFKSGEKFNYDIQNQRWINGPVDLNPKLDPMNLALPIIAGDKRFKPLAESLSNLEIYTIFPDTLRSPQKYDPSKPMKQHGSNWISVLKDQDVETWKPELIAALEKLTGEIDDFEIKQLTGYLIARFRHGIMGDTKKSKWFDASQESDGTLRVAGILAALLQRPKLPVIGIEEPELTIHPGAIRLLYDFIAEAAETSQVLLTTHSPELLDLLFPEAIRLVERIDTKTEVSSLNETQIETVQKKLLTLGELHRSGHLNQQLNLDLEN